MFELLTHMLFNCGYPVWMLCFEGCICSRSRLSQVKLEKHRRGIAKCQNVSHNVYEYFLMVHTIGSMTAQRRFSPCDTITYICQSHE